MPKKTTLHEKRSGKVKIYTKNEIKQYIKEENDQNHLTNSK